MVSTSTTVTLVVHSYEHFINLNRQNKIENLQELNKPQNNMSISKEKTIRESIN